MKMFTDIKITDWIQTTAAVVAVVIGIVTINSWKQERDFDTKIQLMTSLERDYETFQKIHLTSALVMETDTSLREYVVNSVNANLDLINDLKIDTMAFVKIAYYNYQKEKYKEEYNRLIENSYMAIITKRNGYCPLTKTAYEYMHVHDKLVLLAVEEVSALLAINNKKIRDLETDAEQLLKAIQPITKMEDERNLILRLRKDVDLVLEGKCE